MSKAPRVTKAKFLVVTRALKSGQNGDKIASELGLKPSTVKAIRQAKTWPEYERRKKAKASKMQASKERKGEHLEPRPARNPDRVVQVAPQRIISRSDAKLESLVERLGRAVAVIEKYAAKHQSDEFIMTIRNGVPEQRRGWFRRRR